jgi:hypothetical protein
VCALVAAGCQSNPEPPPLDTASTSPSPSPSPSPTDSPPPLPDAAKGTSEASAKTFVRHYFASLNHAMNSGDTRYFRTLGTNDCQSCDAIAGNIEKVYAAGGYISSDGWEVQSIANVPSQPARRPILDLGTLLQRERVKEHAHAEPATFRGGKQPMTAHLVRRGASWKMHRLDRAA